MPLRPLPPTIELTDFSQGVTPMPDDPGVQPESLRDAVNLVLNPVTGTLESRAGYKRMFSISGQDGYRIYSMHSYRRMDGKEYIMCVLSNDLDAGTNNVKVMAYDIAANTWAKVSPDKNWNSPNGRHWGATIDGAFYGGGEEDPMYRWFPGHVARGAWAVSTNYNRGDSVTKGGTTYTALRDHTSHDGTGGTVNNAPDANNKHARSNWTTEWHDNVGTPLDYPTWVEPGVGTTDDTERARDYAFKKGDVVKYTWNSGGDNYTKNFEAKRDIRFDKWDADVKKYRKGDKVSTKYDIDGKGAYWRSWECVETHAPEVANQPGSGGGMWKKIRLARPLDDDGELNNKDWLEMPDAPRTKVAAWWGNRLFARSDKPQTLAYSKLQKVGEKDNRGKAILGKAGDPTWDPDDWRSGGGGGPAGFQPFETQDGDDIVGVQPFGDYFAVLKRFSTHVISGTNPEEWRVRQVGDVGSSYGEAITEHQGLVFFLSDQGLHFTEGTTVDVAPGANKYNDVFRDALDSDSVRKDTRLFSFAGFIWIVLPKDKSGNPGRTVLYHVETQSFWPLDIQMQAAVVTRYQGKDVLFFSTVNDTGTGETVGATFSWDTPGSAPRSKSQMVTAGLITYRNTLLNPNFQSAPKNVDVPHDWQKTDSTKVSVKMSKAAGRYRKGVHVSNLRKEDSTAGLYNGWEGFFQDHADETTGTHNASIFVRRVNWEKHPKKKPRVKLVTNLNPLTVTAELTAMTYKGDGWWRVNSDYTGSTDARVIGFLIPPGSDYHFDQAMAKVGSGTRPYFDGDGGASTDDFQFEGGQRPYIMLYDHPDADGQDDTSDAAGTMQPLDWFMQTAWLTFGAVMEERRIRMLWSLVRGAGVAVTMRTFSNFRNREDGQADATVLADSPINYHEGILPEDCHAISVQVEGASSPAAVLGVAMHTQPRRVRFGRR